MLPKPYIVLFAQRSQDVMKQKGMQAAGGLFPEIATMPEERRAWAIPSKSPTPQHGHTAAPMGGRQSVAPAHLQCSSDTSGHPAQLNATLAVKPPHSPFSLRNYFLIMTELNVLFSQL